MLSARIASETEEDVIGVMSNPIAQSTIIIPNQHAKRIKSPFRESFFVKIEGFNARCSGCSV
jgi:hypothetical protein